MWNTLQVLQLLLHIDKKLMNLQVLNNLKKENRDDKINDIDKNTERYLI